LKQTWKSSNKRFEIEAQLNISLAKCGVSQKSSEMTPAVTNMNAEVTRDGSEQNANVL
jgi:hypothetical protein